MRFIKFIAGPLVALAFLLCGATSAIAGPPTSTLIACDINDDGTKDLAYGGLPATTEANFDKTTLIVAGAVSGTAGNFATGGAVWQLVACGRFGSAGIVSQGVSGGAINFVRVQILDATGSSVVSQVFAPRGGGAWDFAGLADVDGDNLQDIVFLGVDGTPGQPFAKVEIVVGTNAGSKVFVQTANGFFDYVGKGDTDGDGDEDLFFASNDGSFFRVDIASGITEPAKNVVTSGGFTISAIGDITGDGKADLVLQSATTAKLQELDGPTFMTSIFRPNGGGVLVPILTGDADNNGSDDVFFNNSTSTSSTRIDLMNPNASGLGLLSAGFIDTGNFVPQVVADFDADGKTDIAGQAPGATRLTLLNGTTATPGNFVNTNGNYKVLK